MGEAQLGRRLESRRDGAARHSRPGSGPLGFLFWVGFSTVSGPSRPLGEIRGSVEAPGPAKTGRVCPFPPPQSAAAPQNPAAEMNRGCQRAGPPWAANTARPWPVYAGRSLLPTTPEALRRPVLPHRWSNRPVIGVLRGRTGLDRARLEFEAAPPLAGFLSPAPPIPFPTPHSPGRPLPATSEQARIVLPGPNRADFVDFSEVPSPDGE